MIGLIYFLVIILANTVGAISGMGGGVLIKPIFDLIGADSAAAISFYSTVAVFTMSIVSTGKQVKSGAQIDWKDVGFISLGAIFGGIIGNLFFEAFLNFFEMEAHVVLIQIILTIITLIFAFLYTALHWKSFYLKGKGWALLCGLVLGFLASFLGIGGGPINVALLMLMFALPIKKATVYSICIIFFSQLAKIVTIALTTGFERYDLMMLAYVIPAAMIGGFLGAKASKWLSAEKVTVIFQTVIIVVLFINIYNAFMLYI